MIHDRHEAHLAIVDQPAQPLEMMHFHHFVPRVDEVADDTGSAQSVQLADSRLQPLGVQRPFPPVHEREGMEDRRDAVTDELGLQGLQGHGKGEDRARPRLDLLLDAVVVQVDEAGQEEPPLPVHFLRRPERRRAAAR